MKSTTAAACLAAVLVATASSPAWGQGQALVSAYLVTVTPQGGSPVSAAAYSTEAGVELPATGSPTPSYQPLKITLATGATQFQAKLNGGAAVNLSHVKVSRSWMSTSAGWTVQMERPASPNVDWKSWMVQRTKGSIAPQSVSVTTLAGSAAARTINLMSCQPTAWSVVGANAAPTGEQERLTLFCSFIDSHTGSPFSELMTYATAGAGHVQPMASLTATVGGLPLTFNVSSAGTGLTGWSVSDGMEEWDFVVSSIQ
jgi:hypothetical protein